MWTADWSHHLAKTQVLSSLAFICPTCPQKYLFFINPSSCFGKQWWSDSVVIWPKIHNSQPLSVKMLLDYQEWLLEEREKSSITKCWSQFDSKPVRLEITARSPFRNWDFQILVFNIWVLKQTSSLPFQCSDVTSESPDRCVDIVQYPARTFESWRVKRWGSLGKYSLHTGKDDTMRLFTPLW
jgi:hypothetical protein